MRHFSDHLKLISFLALAIFYSLLSGCSSLVQDKYLLSIEGDISIQCEVYDQNKNYGLFRLPALIGLEYKPNQLEVECYKDDGSVISKKVVSENELVIRY